jgi:hypothetical protein
VIGDAASRFALWWCSARAAVRTGESSDDLKSWLLERLSKLLTGWVQLLRAHRVRAEELRRNHRPRTLWSPCTNPCCGSGRAPSDKTILCPYTIRRDRPNPRIFRDILVPTTGVWESCSLQGQCPPAAHALRARNTTKYIARTTSVQALPSL